MTGDLAACDGCLRSMAKSKGVSKTTDTKATAPKERLFIDTSGPYPESIIGSKYWFALVDDFSRYGWRFFGKKKSDMVTIIEHHLKMMIAAGYNIKYIRCDNAGEYQTKLQKVCEENGVILEYISPHTPKINGVVKRRSVLI